ncbi:MAG: calcium-binding protein [Pseudomonadota bacterium]
MATIIVTTLDDITANDGETSLREALRMANNTGQADDIVFASGLSGTVTLVDGALDITRDVSIAGDVDGDGTGDITIDAGGASRVLSVTSGTGTLTDLAITGGYADGAGGGVSVANGATLSVTGGSISGNTAYGAQGGGIYSAGGAVSLSGVTVDGNTALFSSGGGIAAVGGTVTITGSEITSNTASYNGAGLALTGAAVSVAATTIGYNTAQGAYGGGIHLDGGSIALAASTLSRNTASYGAGLSVFGGATATLAQATIATNTAVQGGGIYSGDGTTNLISSTIAANTATGSYGGGVYLGAGTFNATNSIVFGNASQSSSADFYGAPTLAGGNIIGGTITNGAATTGVATVGGTFDALSGGTPVLRDNGGPVRTVAIRADGDADERGDATLLPVDSFDLDGDGATAEAVDVDAAGQVRIANALLDLGAYENVREQLTGSAIDDRLDGQIQGETLTGRGGNDTLFGMGGDDLLDGGSGGDTLDGGDGIDTATYENANFRVRADIAGSLSGLGQGAGDVFVSVENLIGSISNDELRGDGADNTIQGGNGADKLHGRAGDDILQGDAGNDVLYGNSGADRMTGGEGNNRYVYFSNSDSGVGSGNRDVITDFVSGSDRIELFRLDANTTNGGNQVFTFIGTGAFSNTPGELRFFQAPGQGFTIVQGDDDGNGSADFQIELTGVITLDAADFLL